MAPFFRCPRWNRRCASRASKRTKTVCTYCGVGCSFDVWTKDRHILKVEPAEGAANGVSTCIKGKFGWDYVNSPDRLTKPLIREGEAFREASWDEALVSGGAQVCRDQGSDTARTRWPSSLLQNARTKKAI